MQPDPFHSNIVSSILSWVFCLPIFAGIISYVVSIFLKQEDIPRLFSAWLGLCVLILSPLRYMLFQIALATCYPVQSVGALVSTFILALYVPIVVSLLYAVGLGLPMLLGVLIAGFKSSPSKIRLVLATLSVPFLCLLGSLLFSLLLPFAAFTVHWLRADDVIRATNGPAYYIFGYFGSSRAMVALPPYFPKTPQTAQDYLRTHVAYLYLSDREHAYFLQRQYPEITAQLEQP